MADYCTDTFRMVEDNEDSYRMWQGLVGPYYTPWVSQDGTLTWSNNGGLPNPSEVNIMGPQGAGIRIAGLADTEEGLPDRSDIGGIWLVGTELPYEGWAYLRGEWIDLGPLTVGPAGPPGPQGDDYVLTEADKTEIAGIAVDQFEQQLESDPLPILNGGTGARDLAGAQTALGIDEITNKLGTWPLGTDAQDVAGAVNEMIGQISLQGQDVEQLKDNFAGEFSPTSTYAVDAYVVYGGVFWRCTTAVSTAGSWTGTSNWTQVTAGGEMERLRALHVSVPSFSSLPQTVSLAAIREDMRPITLSLGTPGAIISAVTVTTANGSLTIAGTMAEGGSTTAEITLIRTN